MPVPPQSTGSAFPPPARPDACWSSHCVDMMSFEIQTDSCVHYYFFRQSVFVTLVVKLVLQCFKFTLFGRVEFSSMECMVGCVLVQVCVFCKLPRLCLHSWFQRFFFKTSIYIVAHTRNIVESIYQSIVWYDNSAVIAKVHTFIDFFSLDRKIILLLEGRIWVQVLY